MKTVDVTVHYLEMVPSRRTPKAKRDDVSVVHVVAPSVEYYRTLYDGVGSDYRWLSRRKLSDDELASVIHDPQNEMHVLHVEGNPAGFAELDRRQSGEVELVQFGLLPDYIGQGLGTWLIDWTIDRVATYEAKRFWLHTCSLDHPAALVTYKKAGFAQYNQTQIRRDW